jgi:small subunit ribosomal protein S17
VEKMNKETKKTGTKGKMPSQSCDDKYCPFHGTLNVKKRSFVGKVISAKSHKTVTVEWERRVMIPKYERKEKRRTKVHAHSPPCIGAKTGDMVKIIETRPLSKTKNFVIVEKIEEKK